MLAYTRPPEYDEAYSIFLTTPHAHPAWPANVFTPAQARRLYLPETTLPKIAQSLRSNDVHPPLYFDLLLLWRTIFGPAWFTARLLSVLLATAALAALASIATQLRIPATQTIVLCLTSYGFAYTSILARNFALANLLTLLAVRLTLRHCERAAGASEAIQKRETIWAAGLALGAATFTNYLLVFPALTTLAYLTQKSPKRALPALLTFALFLPADGYFYVAQHAARPTQFAPFSLPHTITLLARDSAAAWFGALPLAAPRFFNEITALLILLATATIIAIARTSIPEKTFLAALTLSTPVGLLLLAIAFQTTPIEIRYFATSLPYLALLIATPARQKGLPFPKKAALSHAVLLTQSLALLTLPLTAQPQSSAARQAAAEASPDTIILLPYGNDGVGIPGPFIAAAPATMRILLLHPNQTPDLAAYRNIILVTLTPDAASRATIKNFRLPACWHATAQTQFTRAYANDCGSEPPQAKPRGSAPWNPAKG